MIHCSISKNIVGYQKVAGNIDRKMISDRIRMIISDCYSVDRSIVIWAYNEKIQRMNHPKNLEEYRMKKNLSSCLMNIQYPDSFGIKFF